MQVKRLFDFLTEQISLRPNANFLSAKETTANGKEWRHYTFTETQQYADRVSQLLMNLGLHKDDKVAIISTNRPEWNFVDMGAMQLGITAVPMYPTISEKDYEFIFNDASIQYAFVGDRTVYNKVQPLMGRVASLKGIYSFDKLPEAVYFTGALPAFDRVNQAEIQKVKETLNEDSLATIIYTSGTTGNPKGVMLSHKNIVSNIISVKAVMPFTEGEKSLSFLPLCHSLERTAFYAYLSKGIHVNYAESLDTIAANLKEVHPYCFTTVPRLLEKIYERIMTTGNALTGFKRKLFFWSIDLGLNYELGKNKGPWYNLQLAIARKLVFSKWKEALGGHVGFIVTGAAPMQPRLIKLFTAAGVAVIEGYGLTETSPVLCLNRLEEENRAIGTVGPAIPGVDIKLAADGEILAKGSNIMMGYYNRKDLTDEVIDKDGWFHTGDVGEWLEQNGNKFLKITDRKKELFKTSGGKYVAPQVIENKMKESRYIEQIMVLGESQKFVSALIVPSFVNLADWAKQNGIAVENNEKIVDNSKVKALINDEIERLNQDFGKWEQIKKFTLLPGEWTIESGELTPSLKVKRKVIMEKYKSQVQELYVDERESVA